MTDLYGNIPISGEPQKKAPEPKGKRIKSPPPPSNNNKKNDHTKGKGKYLIIPVAVVLLLITYYGSTTLFIPFYLEKKFPDLFQEKTGLNLDLGSVNFNPLKTALIIEDIHISTLSLNADKTDLLNIDAVYLDLDINAFIQRGIASESLLIKGAQLTITKNDDTTYNISRFLPQGSSDTSAFVNLSKIPFHYSLNNIVVSESNIHFEDISTNTTHRIEDVQLSLPTLHNFTYDIETFIQPGFSAIINGSPIRLTSDAPYTGGVQDDSSKLSLSLQSINLPLYASYIPAQLPVTVKQGSADIEVEIAFKAQQDEDFRLNLDYQVQIENGLFESNDQAVAIETPALRLEGSITPLTRQITIQNVLFRDPVVTVDESVSASTMTNLFLQDANPDKTGDDFLHSAALDVSLLIADNGKCILKSKSGERVFYPVQLSIKNFANAKSRIDNPGSIENSSFRLSGESDNNNSSFSWQGNFNTTLPTGNLEISNLPAGDFLKRLIPDTDITTKGTAEIRGKLSIERSDQAPLAVTLDQGTVELSSLLLEQKGISILQSPKVRFSPLRFAENSLHLGNVFIEGSTLHLHQKESQDLIRALNKKTNSLQGIDFKGNIILGKKEDKSTLKLQNVHLQIKDLEKPQNDNENLAFSATLDKNGSLRAKGSFSMSPVDGVVEIAANNIPATMLFAQANNESYAPGASTLAKATGRYNFSSQSFLGSAELSKGEFTDQNNENSYSFSKAVFDTVSIDYTTGKYSGENVLFKDFTINDQYYNLQADGLSISSFATQGKTTQIDSLEFVRTHITSQKDFSKLCSSLQKKAEDDPSISSIHIFGSLSTADENDEKKKYIDEFDLTITTPSTNTPEIKNIELNAHFVDQGSLSATGTMQVKPLQVQIDMELDRVSSKILHHFPSTLSKSRLNSTMSGTLNFTYPEKIYAGTIQFNEGNLADKTDSPLISWQQAELQNFKIGDSPYTLEADTLTLNTPQTTFTRDNTPISSKLHENVSNYLRELNGQPTDTAISKFIIKRVDLSDGVIDYSVNNVSPPWRINLTSIDGYINNFNIQEADDKIQYFLQGKVANGDFSIESIENEISFKLADFPLNLLEKQLNSIFDVTYAESILNISAKKRASADDYFADITLSSLDVKDYSSTAALALALISEESDKISLSIPLRNSSQSLITQMSNYFQRLIVKCSVSPYLLLEWPYDSLGDRNSVTFAPGKAELTFDSRDTLLDFSTLLEKHPRLQLKLRTIVQRSADTRALRELLTAAERKRTQQENDQLLLEWQQRPSSEDVSSSPKNVITEKDISEKNLTDFTLKSPKDIVITKAMLKQLGIERAEQIQKYILDQSAISEKNIAIDADVSIIDTLDMPEVSIRLGHIGQK